MSDAHLPDFGSSPGSGSSPGPAAVRDAVRRICESRTFKSAPVRQAFLRFVVDRVLSGDAGSIKAYTVAVEALGRPPDFDPASDAIVRVEAGRLRAALERYYESADEAVVISLPRGSYVPTFSWRDPPHHPGARATSEAAQIFAERTEHRAALSRNMEQIHRSVAELNAGLARARATMAKSRAIVERSRASATPEECAGGVAA